MSIILYLQYIFYINEMRAFKNKVTNIKGFIKKWKNLNNKKFKKSR